MPTADYVRWLRARVGPAKVILVYASAIIPDERGQVLFQRRSDFPWWGLPGGVLERGERLQDCLVREVREETGLRIVPQRLIGLYSSPDFDVTYPNGDQVQQVTACYACQPPDDTPRPDGDEILELAYFPPHRLPEVPSWYRAMLADLVDQQEPSFRQGQAGGPASEAYGPWLRRLVGQAPVITVWGAACVRDAAGRVVLVRRAEDGQWAAPGGTMELGERIDRSMARQVRQETGLLVHLERLVAIDSGPAFLHTYANGDQAHRVVAFFTGKVAGGRLEPHGRETIEARFFPPESLPPLHPSDRVRMADALVGQAGLHRRRPE
jgi:ADP-ribose pyrophosphatase YjhB (NUDIX family)